MCRFVIVSDRKQQLQEPHSGRNFKALMHNCIWQSTSGRCEQQVATVRSECCCMRIYFSCCPLLLMFLPDSSGLYSSDIIISSCLNELLCFYVLWWRKEQKKGIITNTAVSQMAACFHLRLFVPGRYIKSFVCLHLNDQGLAVKLWFPLQNKAWMMWSFGQQGQCHSTYFPTSIIPS